MKKIKKLVIGTLMATLIGAGATVSLLGTGCATEQSASDGALKTTFRGREYAVQVREIKSSPEEVTAKIQLVGGPTLQMRVAHRDGGTIASLESADIFYEVRANEKLVNSEYAVLRDGKLLNSQLLWAQVNKDPNLSISRKPSAEQMRVLNQDTLHGTLTGLLRSLASDPAAAEGIELISQMDASAGTLVPTSEYAEKVVAANLEQANPPPPKAPLICDIDPLPTTEEPNPVPPTQPTGDSPVPPTPTNGSDTVATTNAQKDAPNCGKTCNLTKSGGGDGPSFSLNIAGGVVKLEANATHADLSATAWNTDLQFKIKADSGEKYGPVADGIFCSDGKGNPNDYTWTHNRGEVWADAVTADGTVCASPNDKDKASAGELKLDIEGVVTVKHKACEATCDGSAHTRASITGDLSGCWRKAYWYESGQYKHYFVTGSGSVTCTCS